MCTAYVHSTTMLSGVAATMCVLHACRNCQPTMCCAACALQLSVPLSHVLPSLLHRLAPTLSQPTVRHSHVQLNSWSSPAQLNSWFSPVLCLAHTHLTPRVSIDQPPPPP